MPRTYHVLLFGCLLCLSLFLPLARPAIALQLPTEGAEETIRIDGSDQMLTINQLLKQRYEKQFPGAAVELKTSGTEPALQKLLDNEIDLAAVGRSLTAAEKAQGLIEIPLSREKIAIVVGQDNPFQGNLTVEQVSQIFSGKITNWSEVGGPEAAIRLIDRPEESDTRRVLQQYALFRNGFSTDDNVVRLRRDDTSELLSELGTDGISYAIASQLSNQDKARIVKLTITQNVLPDDALYPYSQSRSYVYKPEPSSGAQAFLGFATTKPGQVAVAAAKLAEAKAVAAGEQLVAPIEPVAKPTHRPTAKPVPVASVREVPAPPAELPSSLPFDQPISSPEWVRHFWWLFLPVVGLVVLLFWLVQRFLTADKAAKQQIDQQTDQQTEFTTPSPAPVEPATRVEPTVEPTEVKAAESPAVPFITVVESELLDQSSTDLESDAEREKNIEPQDNVKNKLVDQFESDASVELTEDSIDESEHEPVIIGETVMVVDMTEETTETTPTIRAELVNPSTNVAVDYPVAEPVDQLVSVEVEAIAPVAEPAAPGAAAPSTDAPTAPTPIPLSPGAVALQQNYLEALVQQSKTVASATPLERFKILSELIRERLLSLHTPDALAADARLIAEISAEFLPGPHLENSLINLGLWSDAEQSMQHLGLDLKQLFAQEEEPGLGRGGLGRLMVCYLDALATANVAAIGYGIRYQYGIFDQEIQDGYQVEQRDTWLRHGNPWEVERSEHSVTVNFAGSTEAYIDEQGRYRVRWLPGESVRGIPYDTPIPGYHSQTVNLMRLWRAESSDLCKVLYPADADLRGKALRLKQQFFLVSCALQDALRLRLEMIGSLDTQALETLPERLALQINDTDPTIAIAELMRLLVDEHGVDWEQSWQMTQRIFAYTNHSLMPETLDNWTVGVFGHFLPRHLEIIYEINYRLLETVKAKYPGDLARLARMSLIDERGDRYIRLNYLACVGSHAVNGVSQLHTRLLEQTILHDFYELYPEKFSNKTNGVTPRRFLLQTNPALASLISSKIGDGWITNLEELRQLEAYADDPHFQSQWLQIKQAAKQNLATQIHQQTAIDVDPNSLFDVQAMEVHESKRQHLNLLHILTLYNRIKANPNLEITPRTFIFAGKAAADYAIAKLIIKLVHAVAEVVNHDPEVRGRLKVVFLKDLNIKTAQPIYPAMDLAEHISTAGTEAADIGNMIAILNGALIIGTPDGTNLEIRDAVGSDNFFQFGLTVAESWQRRAQGYSPQELYESNPELKAALGWLLSGRLDNDTGQFQPLAHLLLSSDQYLLLADYASYIDAQARVGQAYRDTESWTRMTILSLARAGRFSADRAVREYCEEIWHLPTASLLEYAPVKKSVG
jgi:starch phosphorylase